MSKDKAIQGRDLAEARGCSSRTRRRRASSSTPHPAGGLVHGTHHPWRYRLTFLAHPRAESRHTMCLCTLRDHTTRPRGHTYTRAPPHGLSCPVALRAESASSTHKRARIAGGGRARRCCDCSRSNEALLVTRREGWRAPLVKRRGRIHGRGHASHSGDRSGFLLRDREA